MTPETILDALRAVRAGGEVGATYDSVAKVMWPKSKAQCGRIRGGAGLVLAELVRFGFVQRIGRGPRSRFVITEAGVKRLESGLDAHVSSHAKGCGCFECVP